MSSPVFRAALLLAGAWLAGACAPPAAQPPVSAAPALPGAASTEAPREVYLLLGQSNMAGRGKVEDADKQPHPGVEMLDQSGAWVPAVEPLHFDAPVAGVGIGRAFGVALAEAAPGRRVGLVPCAVGATAIDAWLPGTSQGQAHPWDDAIRRAGQARAGGVLAAVLWHQGESDATPEAAPRYRAKLDALIARLRTTLDAPDLPFVAGGLGRFPEAPWTAPFFTIDADLRGLPARVPRTAFVDPAGLGKAAAGTFHFDTPGYREFGRRYAAAYIQLAGR